MRHTQSLMCRCPYRAHMVANFNQDQSRNRGSGGNMTWPQVLRKATHPKSSQTLASPCSLILCELQRALCSAPFQVLGPYREQSRQNSVPTIAQPRHSLLPLHKDTNFCLFSCFFNIIVFIQTHQNCTFPLESESSSFGNRPTHGHWLFTQW
jgi:hypothetical protein